VLDATDGVIEVSPICSIELRFVRIASEAAVRLGMAGGVPGVKGIGFCPTSPAASVVSATILLLGDSMMPTAFISLFRELGESRSGEAGDGASGDGSLHLVAQRRRVRSREVVAMYVSTMPNKSSESRGDGASDLSKSETASGPMTASGADFLRSWLRARTYASGNVATGKGQ